MRPPLFRPVVISLRDIPLHYIFIATVLVSGSLSAIPAFAREWHFDVSVDGLPIGTHDIIVQEKGDARSVQSDMRYGVALLGASYKQHAEETWQADCLTRIDTERNRIELWYSPEGEWLGLRSTTRDGHVLSYRLR